jgi:hypothetical protein
VPVAKLETKNGVIHCEGRLPLELAESAKFNDSIERIKQEISDYEQTELE